MEYVYSCLIERRWCVFNKYNIFYCRVYPSKKAAKYNLKSLLKRFGSDSGFYIRYSLVQV